MWCRFYTDDANTGNSHRAAGMTIELRDTGTYGFELPPNQVATGIYNDMHATNHELLGWMGI